METEMSHGLKIFEAGTCAWDGRRLYHCDVNDRLRCVRECNDPALLLDVYDAPPEAHIQKEVRRAAIVRYAKLRTLAEKGTA
jgi:hypothetical protein